jgi:hypothetical protein
MSENTPTGQVGNTQSSGSQEPQGGSVGQSGQGGGGALNSPTVIDLSEDSMVRLPGAKDPVRYGDHYRGFQSEFTKRAQAAKTAETRAAQLQQQLAEYQRRSQSQAQQTQQPNKLKALGEQLRSLTYLSGEQAAGVVGQLTEQFGAYEQALAKRDTALGLMYKRMMQMDQTLQGLNSTQTNASFETKINEFAKAGHIPEKLIPRVKELYLAYEGDDLDQEFPRILSEWYEDIKTVSRDTERQRVEGARRNPFVPGQGGNASPGQKLQTHARSSAKEIADAFWPGMVDGDVET